MQFLVVMLFFVSLLAPLSGLAVEWKSYGIPGASVRNIVADTNRTLCVVVGGSLLYRSSDQGRSWLALPLLPTGQIPKDAIIINDTQPILLVASENCVYFWNSATNSWTARNTGLPAGVFCYDLSASASGRVFLGCSAGAYYSDNAGIEWIKITLPPGWENYAVERAEADSDGSIYIKVFNTYNYFRVESNLTTYTFFAGKPGFPQPNMAPGAIIPNPENSDQLLVVTDPSADAKVYYSNDRGESWSVASGGITPVTPLYPSWLEGNPIVFTDRAVHQLNVSNLSWSVLWTRTIPDKYVLLDLGGGSLLLGNQGRGVWRSTTGGASWAYSSNGMQGYGQVRAIGVVPDRPQTLYVSFLQHGLWKTTDDGKTWAELHQGFEVDPYYGISLRALAVDPGNPDHLIAGTEVSGGNHPYLYYSLNGGENWTKIAVSPAGPADRIYFVKKTPEIVLVGTAGDAIWRSINNGLTFSRVEGTVTDPATYRNVLDFAEESGGRIFAGLVAGFEHINGHAYSDDQGETWTTLEDGSTTSFAADPVRPGRIMRGTGDAYGDQGTGMFFTPDNGTTWNAANTGLPYGGIYYLTYDAAHRTLSDPARSGTYFLLMGNVGVFQTANDGAAWQQIGSDTGTVMEYSPRSGGTLLLGSDASGLLYSTPFGSKSGMPPGVLMLLLIE